MGPIVAVVDNCPTVREALSLILASEGFAVRTFGSGEEFMAARDLLTLSCVLLDVALDGRSSLSLLGRLRETDFRVPVIVMSGNVDQALATQAFEGGGVSYLAKRFDGPTVVDHFQAALNQRASPLSL